MARARHSRRPIARQRDQLAHGVARVVGQHDVVPGLAVLDEVAERKAGLEAARVDGAVGLDRDLGKEIIIFRPEKDGTQRIAINLDQLVYEADPSLNVAVLPGDIVYVPAVEKVRIFVTGAVKTPNLYEVPRSEPVTVLKAVTLSMNIQFIGQAGAGEALVAEAARGVRVAGRGEGVGRLSGPLGALGLLRRIREEPEREAGLRGPSPKAGSP